jgi:16S rRNA (cytosine967-C5)-methyltransferase
VNAILRRALRERRRWISGSPPRRSPPEFPSGFSDRALAAAVRRGKTQQLCSGITSRPSACPGERLESDAGELLRGAPEATISKRIRKAIKVRQLPFQWLLHGLCYVQDPSTLMACDLLDPQPAKRCSTPAPHQAARPAISQS